MLANGVISDLKDVFVAIDKAQAMLLKASRFDGLSEAHEVEKLSDVSAYLARAKEYITDVIETQ